MALLVGEVIVTTGAVVSSPAVGETHSIVYCPSAVAGDFLCVTVFESAAPSFPCESTGVTTYWVVPSVLPNQSTHEHTPSLQDVKGIDPTRFICDTVGVLPSSAYTLKYRIKDVFPELYDA